ncbi:MAG: bifunctional 2-polyprenyl-6-hydroxyphenol methylase/3-demethylubiquinol 3-O-methyltransferase UbiG [Sphingobacteriales bacterium]|nr:MAG: bifunctional 2-polyprenyl-6-hydroxyphenol methylase/3-demethylubiquinol 3-O-methyltransferase UbiG [Sphingobacteriales bacterium]
MLRKDIKKALSRSLDPAEIAKFDTMATEWRNPTGAYHVIHAFNAARLGWLFKVLAPGKSMHLLDVGCATGLVSEAFARQGVRVKGIDASERNITLARTCARRAGLPITYAVATPEDIATATPATYSHVLALEVVEHVADANLFLDAVFRCAKPGGTVVIATLNRTWRSWLLGIIMAEYILGWLPRHTHAWHKFVKPQDIDTLAATHGFTCVAHTGFTFHPLRWRWVPVHSRAVNYINVYQSSPQA